MQPPILMITGSGGAGKSVLLGYLFDLVMHAGGQDPLAGRSVVLVSGGDVQVSAQPTTAELDLAFGEAATGQAERRIGQLLGELRAQGPPPVLLIDTLDQLLTDTSAKPIADLLRRLSDDGALLVVTCRRFDYQTHFGELRQAAPMLHGRLLERRLPPLTARDVERMASAFLERLSDDELPRGWPRSRLVDDFVEQLLNELHEPTSPRQLREIYTSPLLLGLTCATFARRGTVPPDLTVHGLYHVYWSQRVAAWRGKPDQRGQEQESLCLGLAARLLDLSIQRLRLRDWVDNATMAQLDPTGEAWRRLRSEGVLVSLDSGRTRFLHQTFTEYAIGRWLASDQGFPDRIRLLGAVGTGTGSLWPILGELLLNLPADDPDGFAEVVGQVDLGVVDALHAVALAAVERAESEPLRTITEAVLARDANHQKILLHALRSSSPPLIPDAFRLASRVLREGADGLTNDAARVLGQLLMRLPTERERAAALEDALATVHATRAGQYQTSRSHKKRNRKKRDRSSDQVGRSLIMQLHDAGITDAAARDKLREAWGGLGPESRAIALRIHLQAWVSRQEQVALLDVARAHASPAGPVDEQVDLILAAWIGPDGPAVTGWIDWKAMLTDQLPQGWHNPQARAVARLATSDPAVIRGLVDLLLSSTGQTLERAINAVRSLATLTPEQLGQELTRRPTPSTPSACSAVERTVEVLGVTLPGDRRGHLRDWLYGAVPVAPSHVLTALVNLDRDNTPALQAVLDLARQTTTPDSTRVHRRVVDRIVSIAPAEVLHALSDELARTVGGTPGEQAVLQRLHARLAPHDADALEATTTAILKAGEATAGAAATFLIEAAEAADWWAPDYLARLLATPYEHAARLVAEFLGAGYRQGRLMSQRIPTAAVERITSAEDQQLVASLVNILVIAAARGGLTPEDGGRAAGLLLDRLLDRRPSRSQSDTPSRIRSAAYGALARDTVHLLGVLVAHKILPHARDLLLRYLTEVDLAEHPRGVKAVADALVSANRVDPKTLDTAIATWPALPLESQLAVAEALLVAERSQRGGRAEALLHRDDIPTQVRTFLLRSLHIEP